MSTTGVAGITIVIDLDGHRTIVNIPKAEDVAFRSTFKEPEVFLDGPYLLSRIEIDRVGLAFNPIGPYTIRQEDLP